MNNYSNHNTPIANNVEFATFISRAGAYLMDTFIIIAFTLVMNSINIANFKSFLFYLVITTIAIGYKPFLEYKFGATLGKMIFRIRVTNLNFSSISFKQSVWRSLILIIPHILYIPIYYLAFKNPNLKESINLIDFTQNFAVEYPFYSWIGNLTIIIIVLDLIVLIADNTKKNRSLHDRIGKTYVLFETKNISP